MITEHVHISRQNTKLGAYIPSVNMPPVQTCRADAPCVNLCYARKGRFRFPNVKNKAETNLQIWQESPSLFEAEICIAAYHTRFFRWHSSGDIPDERYFEMMVKVANMLSTTKFLCFTKKYELVNQYLSSGTSIPDNLTIVFSAWGDFVPHNPFHLPVAYVQFSNSQNDPRIPPDAKPCQNYCGECVMSGCSCWDLKTGESVVFKEH